MEGPSNELIQMVDGDGNFMYERFLSYAKDYNSVPWTPSTRRYNAGDF
jgi:hypothetical protein